MRLPIVVACLSIFVVQNFCAVIPQPEQAAQPPPPKHRMMRMVKTEANKPQNRAMSCFSCQFLVDGLRELIQQNSTDEEVANFLVFFCETLHVEQNHVCKNIIFAFKDEVIFVLEQSALTSNEVCGSFIKDCGQAEPPRRFIWNITIPGNKPPVKPWPQIPDGKPTYKVLHLSDIHIDRQYAVGSEAYCQLDSLLGTYALCCRNYPDDGSEVSGAKPKKVVVPSGPWGMPYACDIPYQTFDSAIKQMSKNHKDLDYIIVTGDFEAHDAWDYSQNLTRFNIENVTQVFLKYFPKTPVYVSIGNHEGVPQDAMAPHTMPEYDTRGPQWLYKIMSDMWSNWLPANALTTVQYRASYVVRPKQGLKLISINTIYCSEFNFYLYINEVDPDATLEWLIEELADSEANGELVHIISHIPPGDDYCLAGWSNNYFKIIHRYENIIAQQFFGHTHNDHFQVYYDMEDPQRRPFHFNWISPSLTTYDFNNPAYRIYEIDGGYDGATYTVKNAYTYATDLNAANAKNKEPEYTLTYDTKSFYQMKDFSPQSWSDLSDRLWTNTTLFRQFVKLYYRNNYNNECYTNYECRYGFVCEMKSARSYDQSFCDKLTK